MHGTHTHTHAWQTHMTHTYTHDTHTHSRTNKRMHAIMHATHPNSHTHTDTCTHTDRFEGQMDTYFKEPGIIIKLSTQNIIIENSKLSCQQKSCQDPTWKSLEGKNIGEFAELVVINFTPKYSA